MLDRVVMSVYNHITILLVLQLFFYSSGLFRCATYIARKGLLMTATAPHIHLTEEPQILLTNREQDMLNDLRRGLSRKEIRETRYLARQTVDGYLKNLYRKLGVKKAAQAVHKAQELGL
jgi:DNA-binding NarL/FixJ family response regulator